MRIRPGRSSLHLEHITDVTRVLERRPDLGDRMGPEPGRIRGQSGPVLGSKC